MNQLWSIYTFILIIIMSVIVFVVVVVVAVVVAVVVSVVVVAVDGKGILEFHWCEQKQDYLGGVQRKRGSWNKLDGETECKFAKDHRDMLPIFYLYNRQDIPYYLQTKVLSGLGLCPEAAALL